MVRWHHGPSLGAGPAGVAFFYSVQLLLALALTVVLRAGEAPSSARPSPEAELDQLLAASTAKVPPPEVVVLVVGPDAKRYRLEEVTVRLDGEPFPALAAVEAATAPKGTVVSDGDHVVSAKLVYRGQPLGPLPWEEGPKWTLPARVTLQASRGLRFTVRLTVEANELAPATQRLTLHSEVEPEMLVPVDDAPLPPPPVAHLPVAAGPPLPPTVAAAPAPAATPAAKKKRKKVTRAARATTAVPAAATVSTTASAAGSPNALEEATARLRSALAAPQDGGAEASH